MMAATSGVVLALLTSLAAAGSVNISSQLAAVRRFCLLRNSQNFKLSGSKDVLL